MTGKTTKEFSPEVRERTVRLVLDHAHEYPSRWQAILSISAWTLEWERIHETLIEADFNISETARRRGMYRRTLARKLQKWRVK